MIALLHSASHHLTVLCFFVTVLSSALALRFRLGWRRARKPDYDDMAAYSRALFAEDKELIALKNPSYRIIAEMRSTGILSALAGSGCVVLAVLSLAMGIRSEMQRSLILDADVLAQTRQYSQAKAKCLSAERLDALAPAPHAIRGRILVAEMHFAEAVPELTLAANQQHSEPAAALELGGCLLRLNRQTEAESWFRKALAMAPRNWKCYADLGQCLAASGKLDDAARLFRFAVALNPQSEKANSCLGMALQALGDKEQGLYYLEVAAKSNPNSLVALNALGTSYANAGRFAEAAAQFRAEIAQEPRFAAGYFNLARTLEQMGDESAARAAYLSYFRRCAASPNGTIVAAPEASRAFQRLIVAGAHRQQSAKQNRAKLVN